MRHIHAEFGFEIGFQKISQKSPDRLTATFQLCSSYKTRSCKNWTKYLQLMQRPQYYSRIYLVQFI